MGTSQKTSEVEKIFRELQEMIVTGELPTGCRLIESQIAELFGVSRTPTRLAIERLASIGLVEHTPNRGAIVHQPSFEELKELLQIRQINEGLTARMAAQKCREEDAVALYEILDKMRDALEADDTATYSALSSRIHLCIMEIAHNRFLTDFVMRIYMITSRYHMAITSLPYRANSSYLEHRAIVDAIASHDGDAAEQAMVQHIGIIKNFFSNEHSRIFFPPRESDGKRAMLLRMSASKVEGTKRSSRHRASFD